MGRVDAATGWSLGLWFVFGLVPAVGESMGWHALLNHQGAAAWVQAVGSVLAIMAAVFISSDQHRRDIARRNADRAEPIAMRGALATHAGMALNTLQSLLKEQTDGSLGMYITDTRKWHAYSQRFADSANALLQINLNDLSHHMEILYLSMAKESIRQAQRQIEKAKTLATTTQRDFLKSHAEGLLNIATLLDRLADDERKGRS